MYSDAVLNRRIVLASRPQGLPTLNDFRLEDESLPAIAEGQILLRTLYLSLDPYMRSRMNDAPSYAPPVEIGEVMVGGTVSRVEQSRNSSFKPGDLVVAAAGWQTHCISNGDGLTVIPEDLPKPSLALGVMGMPGMTGYMGLMEIGKPVSGETLVVAAASGAVGSVVGQLAKTKGLRVVGIAGGREKCEYTIRELGFDTCIDHTSPTLHDDLRRACPDGIDIYFELVGGKVFEAVLPLLNEHARIPLCGLIAQFHAQRVPDGPNYLPLLMRTLLTKRARIQGFIVYEEYGHLQKIFTNAMLPLIKEGRVKYREDLVDGLENAPAAFIGMLEGKNFGKLVIRVS